MIYWDSTFMKKYCCEEMDRNIMYRCDVHPDPYDCPDNLIAYHEVFDEFGIIIHDGAMSNLLINYCPWCGHKLPVSKRDKWFEELEKLGYDDPFDQNIPKEYLTDEWWNKKNNKRGP